AVDARPDAPLKAWMRALAKTAPISANPYVTLPALIDDLADAFETAPAFLDDGQVLSYRDFAQRCNRFARWALGQHLEKGDVVCLLMPNCADYMAIWLGDQSPWGCCCAGQHQSRPGAVGTLPQDCSA